jgi:hypothetical protein
MLTVGRMMRNNLWTKDDLSNLANLIARGVTGDAIAIEMGRTKAAIVAQVRNSGLSFAPGQRGKMEQAKGRSVSAFSRLFGD